MLFWSYSYNISPRRRNVSAMKNTRVNDPFADLFTLDPHVGAAENLNGHTPSGDCTNDGCTGSCVGC